MIDFRRVSLSSLRSFGIVFVSASLSLLLSSADKYKKRVSLFWSAFAKASADKLSLFTQIQGSRIGLLSRDRSPTTIGAGRLNGCVRNGNRCDPSAEDTRTLDSSCESAEPYTRAALGIGQALGDNEECV